MNGFQRCEDRVPAHGGTAIGEASCRSVWSRLAAPQGVESGSVVSTGYKRRAVATRLQ
jgi:hypothetical protein